LEQRKRGLEARKHHRARAGRGARILAVHTRERELSWILSSAELGPGLQNSKRAKGKNEEVKKEKTIGKAPFPRTKKTMLWN
jgi:hypothetical protein